MVWVYIALDILILCVLITLAAVVVWLWNHRTKIHKSSLSQFRNDDLYEKLAALMDLKGPAEVIPEGVEVTVRTDGEKDYAILQNFSRQPAKVKLDQGWTLIENGTLILETENNHRDQQEEAWLNPLETQVFCKIKKEQA